MLNYFQSSASTEKLYVPGPESTITEDFSLKQITNYVLPLEITVSFLGFFFLVSPFPLLTQPSCSSKSELKLWGKASSSEAATLWDRLKVLVASLPSGASSPCQEGR